MVQASTQFLFSTRHSTYLGKQRTVFINHVCCYDMLAAQQPQQSSPAPRGRLLLQRVAAGITTTHQRMTTAFSHLPRETVDHPQWRGYQVPSKRG